MVQHMNQFPGVKQAEHPSTLQASHTECSSVQRELHSANFTGIQHPAAHTITLKSQKVSHIRSIYASVARLQGRETLFHPQSLHVISTPHMLEPVPISSALFFNHLACPVQAANSQPDTPSCGDKKLDASRHSSNACTHFMGTNTQVKYCPCNKHTHGLIVVAGKQGQGLACIS